MSSYLRVSESVYVCILFQLRLLFSVCPTIISQPTGVESPRSLMDKYDAALAHFVSYSEGKWTRRNKCRRRETRGVDDTGRPNFWKRGITMEHKRTGEANKKVREGWVDALLI